MKDDYNAFSLCFVCSYMKWKINIWYMCLSHLPFLYITTFLLVTIPTAQNQIFTEDFNSLNKCELVLGFLHFSAFLETWQNLSLLQNPITKHMKKVCVNTTLLQATIPLWFSIYCQCQHYSNATSDVEAVSEMLNVGSWSFV